MTGWKCFAVVSSLVILSSILMGCGGKRDTQKFEAAREAFLEAKQAVEQGDTVKAIEAYSRSLEVSPSVEGYLERAKLYAEKEEVQKALADCESARQLNPESEDVKWLKAEIEKPANQRFQGETAKAPSSSK